MHLTFLNQVWETSRRIFDGRNKYMVLAKGMEEMGELAQEVMIVEGHHYKPPGKDGIIGEAVDVMVCMADIIFQTDPTITEEEVQAILAKKLAKWQEKDMQKICASLPKHPHPHSKEEHGSKISNPI